jgi:Na+/proline symporter
MLSPTIILSIVAAYFLVLMLVSYFTSRNTENSDFFIANRKSPWVIVAIGMIGASLSGVTFISIPGVVGQGGTNMAFSYMQMVMGYLLGYFVIAKVLIPVYYKWNLTSIYGYLEQRFGTYSYKIGAAYFLLSRVIGASFRLFLVAIILQKFVMDPLGVPFFFTVLITIILIWVYTFRGGIKTIVWTDTIQTVCMLSAVILTVFAIGDALDQTIPEMIDTVKSSDYGQLFFFEGGWGDANNFFKQFLSGALIAIVMTGMDQDMMQKNLSCRTKEESQKNIFLFSIILIFANLLFLFLGALLYIYAADQGITIPEKSDELYATIALNYLTPTIGIAFVLGLIAAAYSSADSALTALTTSFCVDFLNFEKSEETELKKKKKRLFVHIGFSIILLTTILLFSLINNRAVINELFTAAGYTYGPILGLFTFGLTNSRPIKDKLALVVCLLAPILSYAINKYSAVWFDGLELGFLILLVNGMLTYLGLLLISSKADEKNN